MDLEKLKDQLIAHEALRLKPYRCTEGVLTIGVGRSLDTKGISKEEAFYLLDNDITECVTDLSSLFYEFNNFPESIQHVLIDMRFNLGSTGFRKFKKMIKAVKARDIPEMIAQMKDSGWYGQVKSRADNLIRMVT